MVARSWADRLAELPLSEEEIIDGLARAIYSTHHGTAASGWKEAPEWVHASDAVREWVRAQAQEALFYLRAMTRPSR
jgi:hypothetical protein